jgi:hypothetical protein
MTPQAFGDALGLNATVTPDTAVGAVTFLDGSTPIGSPVPVVSGAASLSPTNLPAGTHSITAQFVPTNPANFGASQSDPSSVEIDPATTTLSLAALPGGPQPAGSPVTLTASLTPMAATGQVEFFDGSTSLGTVTVSGGSAVKTVTSLAGGDHSLTATYTPSTGNYATSTSLAVPYTISVATTTTGLAITPATPAASGVTETFSATITPAAATGTVQFMDGADAIGSPVTVSGGTASTTGVLATGSHSVTAVFTSSDSNSFSDSTSDSISYDVSPPATTTATTLDVSPSDSVLLGDPVTLAATVTPSTAVGSVTFYDGSAVIGTPVTVADGTATTTTSSLKVGSHSLKAVFNPTNSADFTTSSSAVSTLAVNTARIDGVTSGGSTLGSGASVKPGQSITIDASGFTPDASVTVTLHSSPVLLTTTTADASGAVHVTVKLPSNVTAGGHTIILSDGTHIASFAITVASSGQPGLADTGVDVSGGLSTGEWLLGAGVLLMAGASLRRRRYSSSHSL